MKLVDTASCTGCGACVKICPKTAISYIDDAEGFPTPVIDGEQCVECGLCEKVCPAINPPKKNPVQAAYAVQMLDKEALKDSTSGGLFTVFSREIFKRGGVVYGCIWDEQYNAVIRRAENEEEMKPMRGSKYVWSYAADCYPEIKECLQNGRTVLFTGLPCQVAGLKNYLRKDYDNLYLLDFFCGGSPSPMVFQSYLKTIIKGVPLEKLNLKFRDKEKFGVGIHISYEGKTRRIHQSHIRNPYFYGYSTKVFHRRPCYHCLYRYEQRVEDLTVGDYWGVSNFHSEFDVRGGVSTLLINSPKGVELLETVRNQLQISETRIEDIAAENNLTLGDKKKIYPMAKFRDAFFKAIRENGWKAAERKYLFNILRLMRWVKTKLPTKTVNILKEVKRKIKGV